MRISRLMTSFLSIFIAISANSIAAKPAARLPSLGADATRVSVSGLSSGAFMAVQYEVAHSADIIGIGVVAGGGYNCAGLVSLGNPLAAAPAALQCMEGASSGTDSYLAATSFALAQLIDPVSGIARHKVYLFSGTSDDTVKQAAMNHLKDFYDRVHVPSESLTYVNTMQAGHAFISPYTGGQCAVSAAPYVNQCPAASGPLYDQAGAILSQIYGQLKPKASTPSSKPVAFDQAEFYGALISGMAATGYAYIPAQCKGQASKCPVHVVFHGCEQSADTLQSQKPQWKDEVYVQVGYNEWADTNGIIILYPQVDVSPFNPKGCWDWWGYAGGNYQTKTGAQIMAVQAMISRLTS